MSFSHLKAFGALNTKANYTLFCATNGWHRNCLPLRQSVSSLNTRLDSELFNNENSSPRNRFPLCETIFQCMYVYHTFINNNNSNFVVSLP